MLGLSRLQTLLFGTILVGGLLGTTYLIGKWDGEQEAEIETIERTIEALKERDKVDAEISTSDAVDLCMSMGLSHDDELECVRRLAETDTEAGNSSDGAAD